MSTTAHPPQADSRYDSHPAALALAEIVLIALGFYAFPAGQGSADENPRKDMLAYLSDSFRASVFGA